MRQKPAVVTRRVYIDKTKLLTNPEEDDIEDSELDSDIDEDDDLRKRFKPDPEEQDILARLKKDEGHPEDLTRIQREPMLSRQEVLAARLLHQQRQVAHRSPSPPPSQLPLPFGHYSPLVQSHGLPLIRRSASTVSPPTISTSFNNLCTYTPPPSSTTPNSSSSSTSSQNNQNNNHSSAGSTTAHQTNSQPLTPNSDSAVQNHAENAWPYDDQFKQDSRSKELCEYVENEDPNCASGSEGSPWCEQVKQLYELSDDPKRKEFLDDLFTFMQKKGHPINRIPIMAKQVLDLYELYNLVTSRGGLVEVINKKIWREITKGLNLPSSITSAAFTLRTQYMKYLYPYECEKKGFSTSLELQAAIDGNRREGRRSSYSTYADMVAVRSPAAALGSSAGMSPSVSSAALAGLNLNSGSTVISSQISPLSLVTNRHHINGNSHHGMSSHSSVSDEENIPTSHHRDLPLNLGISRPQSVDSNMRKHHHDSDSFTPPSKRSHIKSEDGIYPLAPAGTPSTHLKINSRGDSKGGIDNSLAVSMEINGIIYQGILFASATTKERMA